MRHTPIASYISKDILLQYCIPPGIDIDGEVAISLALAGLMGLDTLQPTPMLTAEQHQGNYHTKPHTQGPHAAKSECNHEESATTAAKQLGVM